MQPQDPHAPICGAKTRSGKPCTNPPMHGRTRCRMHGGATPIGIAAPSYKHGRYSTSIPARLAATYETGLDDPQLLELREEIALIDARLAEVLREIDGLGDSAKWADAKKAWITYQYAPNVTLKAKAQADLEFLIDQGANQHAAWAALQNLIEQRRKLVESEHKRLVQAQQTISAEQAMALVGGLLGIMKQHIHDRATLSAIQTDVARLLDRPPDRRS